MKKLKVLLIAVVVLGLQNLHAQKDRDVTKTNSREARKKLVFGFKAGFNNSNVYSQSNRDFVAKSKVGGVLGGFIAIPFGEFIGFQPEILLSQKGFSGSGTLRNEAYSLNRTTTHLDIPLQLQLKPFGWLSMLAGIQYSYLLKQKDEFSNPYNNNNYQTVVTEFNNDNVRKNLVGIVMGGDVNFWHLVVSARVGWDILSNHGDGNTTTPQYKNTWFQGTLGYRIY